MRAVLAAVLDHGNYSPANVGIEYEGHRGVPKVTSDIPEGTVREQLDKIAESVGYEWLADGDWINFIPKGKIKDPDYIMNQRIPGRVVVSRDPSRLTPIRGWLDARLVGIARDISGVKVPWLRRPAS